MDEYNETSFTEQPSMAAEVMDYDGSEVATSSRAESSEEMSELEVELDSEDSLDGDQALEDIVQPIVAKAASQVLKFSTTDLLYQIFQTKESTNLLDER